MKVVSSFLILAVSFLSAYFLSETAGLFTARPLSSLEVLYSIPFLAVSTAVLLLTALWMQRNIREMTSVRWLRVLTVVLLVGALWLSFLTRFSVSVVLTEGQTFYTGHRHSEPEALYTGRFASVEDVGVELIKLEPDFSADGQDVERLTAMIQVYGQHSESGAEHSITDGLPRLIGGVLLTMRDFGYSLRYVLKSEVGRMLDSSFIYMRLFPPESEDSFRLLSPVTYYVRYYPDSREGNGPLIGLRIVRNKDIVFNDDVRFSEEVAFENSRISFEEARKWTRLCITRDWGMMAVLAGIISGVLSLAAVFAGHRKRNRHQG